MNGHVYAAGDESVLDRMMPLAVLPLCRGLSALGPSCQILSQLTVISLTGSLHVRSDLN